MIFTFASAWCSVAIAWSRSACAAFCFATSSCFRFAVSCASSSAALRVREIAFRLVHGRLVDGRIDLRDDLPGFHRRIEIDEQLLDVAGDLAADLHVDDRIQRARRGHGLASSAPRATVAVWYSSLAGAAAAAENRSREAEEQRRRRR